MPEMLKNVVFRSGFHLRELKAMNERLSFVYIDIVYDNFKSRIQLTWPLGDVEENAPLTFNFMGYFVFQLRCDRVLSESFKRVHYQANPLFTHMSVDLLQKFFTL